ncbi:Hypothetical protein A7982_11202 [Minicystis rosea]|nr:Hypothetical protein A7982_11202 [Minicystis rosea]
MFVAAEARRRVHRLATMLGMAHPPSRRPTPLMIFFGLCALAGAVVPWHFNLAYFHEHGRFFTAGEFLAAGFQVSPMHSSIASDFWIGTTPALVWMIVEARRLRMARPWAYVVITFLVAFACAFPLFLLMRERRLSAEPRAS